MNSWARACALLCALNLGVLLPAQTVGATGKPETIDPASRFTAAAALRVGLAGEITARQASAQEALERLRAMPAPLGIDEDPDTQFALAALDIGQRLIAAGQPAPAEECLKAAEMALSAALGRTADRNARDKTLLLRKLALLRARYLNKPDQARADIDAALKLAPDDRQLQEFRQVLATEKPQSFKTKASELPTK